MPEVSRGPPPSFSTSISSIANLFPLVYLFAPLNAAGKLPGLPWELDEERSYHYSQLSGYPPWQHTLLDAFAALCTLQPDCSSVCVSLWGGPNQLLVALPHIATVELQEAIDRCLVELQPLAEPGRNPRQVSRDEVKFIDTVYRTCYTATRDLVVDEGRKALLLLDAAIKEGEASLEATGGEDGEDRGAAWVAYGYDDCLDEAECEPETRTVKPSDVPRLDELRRALRDLLSAMDKGEAYVAIYDRGIAVLECVEDKELVSVLRGIEYFLRLTFVRKICAVPWTVRMLMHVARSSNLLQPRATLPKSVAWISPPQPLLPLSLSLPPTEALVDVLRRLCPEMSRDDCMAATKLAFECLEISERRNSSTAGDTPACHAEAVLIHHIISNKISVYAYLATSPIALSWSCYACARLLSVVNAEYQLQLTLRACSDEVGLPSRLPTFGENIEAAFSTQVLEDVKALARGHLKATKDDEPPWELCSIEEFMSMPLEKPQNSQE